MSTLAIVDSSWVGPCKPALACYGAVALQATVRTVTEIAGISCDATTIVEVANLEDHLRLSCPKTLKFLTREMQLALLASANCRQRLPPLATDRVGIVAVTAPSFSTLPEISRISEECVVNGELDTVRLASGLSALMPARWPLRSLKALTACHIAAEHQWTGPNVTIAPSQSAFSNALLTCQLLLESNAADIMILCTADSRVDDISVAQLLARRNQISATNTQPDSPVASEAACAFALTLPDRLSGPSIAIELLSQGYDRHAHTLNLSGAPFARTSKQLRDFADCTVCLTQPEFSTLDQRVSAVVPNWNVREEIGEVGVAAAGVGLAYGHRVLQSLAGYHDGYSFILNEHGRKIAKVTTT